MHLEMTTWKSTTCRFKQSELSSGSITDRRRTEMEGKPEGQRWRAPAHRWIEGHSHFVCTLMKSNGRQAVVVSLLTQVNNRRLVNTMITRCYHMG